MTESQRALPAPHGSRAGSVKVDKDIADDKAVTQIDIDKNVALMREGSELIPRIRIAARPASPRLRLVLEGGEADGSDRLLWQAMLPGEQAAPVTLPADPLAKEWAAALEQVLAFCQREPVPEVLPRLRLDIESDAPCLVKLSSVALSLQAEHALLADPLRVDFDGKQHASRDLVLAPTHPGSPLQLTLKGRLRAADTPPAGALPGAGGS